MAPGRLDARELEARTQAIGRELFGQARQAHDRLNPLNRWARQVLTWCLSDPQVKAQVLRFIDCLPNLRTPRAVVEHISEYFADDSLRLPPALRLGVTLSRRGLLTAPAVALFVRQLVEHAARQFIAGARPEDAVLLIKHLATQGAAASFDILGEQVVSAEEAEQYARRYVILIEALGRHASHIHPAGFHYGSIQPLHVSMKPTGLAARVDPTDRQGSIMRLITRLQPILRLAQSQRVGVTLDMEHYELRDLTLDVAKALLETMPAGQGGGLGIVLQAYLRDSEEVLAELMEWLKTHDRRLSIRLVKGAYWDSERAHAAQRGWPCPVYEHKWETDQAFERLTLQLLRAHPLVRPAIASHNLRSIAYAMAAAELAGLPKDQVEFQLLYGMGATIQEAIVSRGFPVRVYTPLGELIPGMAYLVRRILENTANESFLRHDLLQDRSPAELLAVPGPPAAPEPAKPAVRASAPLTPPPSTPASAPPAPVLRKWSPTGGRNPESPSVARDSAQSVSRGSGPEPTANVGRVEGSKPSEPQPAIEVRSQRAETAPQGEPMRDFSQAADRDRMIEALTLVRSSLGVTYPALLARGPVSSGETLVSRNPANPEELLGRVVMTQAIEVDEAVRQARSAQPDWASRPVIQRAAILRRAADVLRAHREELTAWVILEVGKTWAEADGDVVEGIDFLEYYAEGAVQLARGKPLPQRPGEQNLYRYQPRGVAAVIAPWNFPVGILTGMSAAALAVGNAVILKPAEQSSMVAARVATLLREAGVPPAVFQCMPGLGPDVGAALVEHPGIQTILFTGSRAVGMSILDTAAHVRLGQRFVKHVVLELGGKNAILIDDDADLDAAVAGTIASAFGYQGQKCSAASRVIVHQSVYERFLERLIEATDRLVLGDPSDPGTDLGPLIDEEAQRRLLVAAEQAGEVAQATYQYPEDRVPQRGYFVGPTIVAGVPPRHRLATEELFGPLLCVFRVETFEEALELANDTDYGLTGGVYSRSPAHVQLAVERFDVGNLYVNRPITGSLVGRQPFGGRKLSGLGTKAGGPDYLQHLMLPKTISENTTRHGMPLE